MRYGEGEYDSLIFKPRRDIIFIGFGMMANFSGKDMTFLFKWKIDGEESEVLTKEFKDAEKDPEKKWFTIDMQDLGKKPIKVSKDVKIEIYCRVEKEEMAPCFDGMEGLQHQYSTIAGQEYDFDTQGLNSGNTDQEYGQFPFILY